MAYVSCAYRRLRKSACLKIDGYLLAILGAILLGLLWPAPAVNGGVLHLNQVVQIGMGCIFLFHGASLAPETLRTEAAKWRIHVLVQAVTFIVFPVVTYALYLFGTPLLPPEARLGFFFLGAVSTTISSSIAMTAIARGNVAIAIFNATLSGLIGLLLTPLLVSLIRTAGTLEFSLLDAFLRICQLLLLPFVAGQLLRKWLGPLVMTHKRATGLFERGVIVLIVLNAFANATAGGLWTQYDAVTLLSIALLVALLLAAAIILCRLLSRSLGLPAADEAAFVFCGSTKSLANGAPIAQILFGSSAAAAAILLPLVLYHQFQLVAVSVMARAYAARAGSRIAEVSCDGAVRD